MRWLSFKEGNKDNTSPPKPTTTSPPEPTTTSPPKTTTTSTPEPTTKVNCDQICNAKFKDEPTNLSKICIMRYCTSDNKVVANPDNATKYQGQELPSDGENTIVNGQQQFDFKKSYYAIFGDDQGLAEQEKINSTKK
jgi:hypothetical protein